MGQDYNFYAEDLNNGESILPFIGICCGDCGSD